MLHRIRYWIRAIFRHEALDRDIQEEMQLHIDRRTEMLIASGVRPEEARLTARREFGNPTAHHDASRDALRTRWIDSIRGDVRFALRYFARKPLSSATIILVLAFGIGGNAFQVSMLLSITKRPPPGLSDEVPLVRLRGMYRAKDAPGWHARRLWYSELREIAEVPNTFAAVAGSTRSRVAASAHRASGEETLWATFVTTDFFRVIGVPPTHGPGLPATDNGPQLVGVISYGMWEDAFERGEVAGHTVTVNGVPIRIVGVAPEQFTDAVDVVSRHMIWLPLSSRATVLGVLSTSARASLDSTGFEVVGLLRPGISPERATAAARVVTARVAARMIPAATSGAANTVVYESDVVPLRGITKVGSDLLMVLALWGVLATLVMALVCTNVSGLVISAAVGRQHEIAVRLSLGASRGRVIRQLLTESVLLAFAGGVLGLVVYLALIAVASRIPDAARFRPDLETVVYTMLIALGTGILFGLAPAFHATRHGVAEALKSEGGATRRSRMHQSFVVAQVLLIQPLLVLIAALLVTMRGPDRNELPAGVPDHVLRLRIDAYDMPGTSAENSAALRRLVQRLGQTPGVAKVLPDPIPLRSATVTVREEDRGTLSRAKDPIPVDMMLSPTGYFDLVGVPLLRGNDLAPVDTERTAIISSDLARALWGGADPIGKRLTPISPTLSVSRDLTVAGVYDSRHLSSGYASAQIYRPVKDWPAYAYLIRTAGPAAPVADTVRRIVREELPSTPIEELMTLAEIAESARSSQRVGRLAGLGVATLVLLLASMGLYGIVALSVGQRRREIGVRMALGARAIQVVALFYRNGAKLGALGLGLGLPISLAAVRFSHIVDQQTAGLAKPTPNLWIIGAAVAVAVGVVASIATLIPATRAATVNPVIALRAE